MANEEASPICRGKNLSWETILLFYNNMPRVAMPKAKFHSFVESKINGWTQTHSQIARQLAFYYEKDGICYPRFTARTKYVDLFAYMQNWATKYFIPNPYTPSLRAYNPVCIYSHLKRCISKGLTDFDEALDSLFEVNLSSHDKVNVYLSNFTDLVIDSNHKMNHSDEISEELNTKEIGSSLANDVEGYYNYFNIQVIEGNHTKTNLLPLQQIFYGAPGTGKSHGINEQTKGKSVIRTTFHPDSDYSTFVGCYKPTKEYIGKKLNKNLSFQDLANILNGYYNDPDNGHIGGLQKFVYEYVSYLNGDIMNVNVTQLLQQAGVGTSYNVEINKYVKFCTLLPKRKESRITYEFVAQAFTKAYVLAWQEYLKGSEKPVFLIIEEINRGNCAQIFGDLFQLLDRSDDGFSSYPIKSDTDLGNFIAEEMSGFDSQEYASIINGDELLLPPNLYIWATMNTSDQSLFPIDSAFKRRWDWVYIPINIEAKTGWHIDVNDKKYKWSSFLEKINNEIEVTTSSEDKQLGFFFCKAEETDANGNNGKITAERFVSKVLFYLYNDVFKDYGLDQDFFKDKVDGKPIAFRSLFKMDGSLNEERVEMLLENLGVEEA